jgi:hypothetical protein
VIGQSAPETDDPGQLRTYSGFVGCGPRWLALGFFGRSAYRALELKPVSGLGGYPSEVRHVPCTHCSDFRFVCRISRFFPIEPK